MTAIGDAKRAMRREARTRLAAMDAQQGAAASDAIAEHLVGSDVAGSDVFASAPAVVGFVALAGEPDVSAVLTRALGAGKRVALPRIEPGEADGSMTFRWIDGPGGLAGLARGAFGLLEPGPATDRVESLGGGSLVLVPGLAFDGGGGRLGRGKGYYDRALAEVTRSEGVVLAGVCFGAQVVPRVPREDHDRAVHMIVTEAGRRQAT